MEIEKIYDNGQGGLSVRSLNVCKHNGLNTVQDLKDYLKNNKHFLKLKYCGVKSNAELFELVEKY